MIHALELFELTKEYFKKLDEYNIVHDCMQEPDADVASRTETELEVVTSKLRNALSVIELNKRGFLEETNKDKQYIPE